MKKIFLRPTRIEEKVTTECLWFSIVEGETEGHYGATETEAMHKAIAEHTKETFELVALNADGSPRNGSGSTKP